MTDSRLDAKLDRRGFLKAGGATALTAPILGVAGAEAALASPAPQAAAAQNATAQNQAGQKQFPQIAMIVPYSPQNLAFASSAGYQGVVVPVGNDFNPNIGDAAIDKIIQTARDANIRIISIEAMNGYNHSDPDPAKRRDAQQRFLGCVEFAHRLGCKFVGTFSGGIPGASADDQAKAFADAFNEVYAPVLEKLDMSIGWENYPTPPNFATVPAYYDKVFALVPNKRLGLEFDPSHYVRQFIDPIQVAWNYKDRILAVHLKDTEITQPVLQQVGIHGTGWWRYRIPGQGLVNWPAFFTCLLQAGFSGGMAVEHEDQFWDQPHTPQVPELCQARKDGFNEAMRFLRLYMPGRTA
ncbi:MAG TPA: sugar phosphate isomerase/epimerase family protein [Candidatus Acidoferrales bacterium]|jgi:sugar phosphate isomerase/epimerase|nr:sugar phosphate isomerase/epimerase family protein [Candidatus Acidoferrales bacterium]